MITRLPSTANAVKQPFTVLLSDLNYHNLNSDKQEIAYANAGAHNSIYRGKYLGSSVTTAQYTSISNGTFDDMFIGDYWTIGGVNYRIAAFDYWLRTGDTQCTTHHVVLVPDANLYTAQMNETNTTGTSEEGGYAYSKMRTTNLETAKNTINTAFGSGHVLSHREILTNAVSDGKASGLAWYDSTVELMNEAMVYGHSACGSAPGYETGVGKSQLSLFALDHSRICNPGYWWLRGVVSATHFAMVGGQGQADRGGAGYAVGVRPAFGIC